MLFSADLLVLMLVVFVVFTLFVFVVLLAFSVILIVLFVLTLSKQMNKPGNLLMCVPQHDTVEDLVSLTHDKTTWNASSKSIK